MQELTKYYAASLDMLKLLSGLTAKNNLQDSLQYRNWVAELALFVNKELDIANGKSE